MWSKANSFAFMSVKNVGKCQMLECICLGLLCLGTGLKGGTASEISPPVFHCLTHIELIFNSILKKIECVSTKTKVSETWEISYFGTKINHKSSQFHLHAIERFKSYLKSIPGRGLISEISEALIISVWSSWCSLRETTADYRCGVWLGTDLLKGGKTSEISLLLFS